MAQDPVCNMAVDANTAAAKTEYKAEPLFCFWL